MKYWRNWWHKYQKHLITEHFGFWHSDGIQTTFQYSKSGLVHCMLCFFRLVLLTLSLTSLSSWPTTPDQAPLSLGFHSCPRFRPTLKATGKMQDPNTVFLQSASNWMIWCNDCNLAISWQLPESLSTPLTNLGETLIIFLSVFMCKQHLVRLSSSGPWKRAQLKGIGMRYGLCIIRMPGILWPGEKVQFFWVVGKKVCYMQSVLPFYALQMCSFCDPQLLLIDKFREELYRGQICLVFW